LRGSVEFVSPVGRWLRLYKGRTSTGFTDCVDVIGVDADGRKEVWRWVHRRRRCDARLRLRDRGERELFIKKTILLNRRR
jgi:hypothetical protein